MDIARALGGLGAAFKNEVPQFREQIRIEDLDRMAMDDRNMASQEKRQKTLFLDARAAKTLADGSNFSAIADIYQDRLDLLPDGVDNKDSLQIRDLALGASSSPETAQKLMSVLNNTIELGSAYGVYDDESEIPSAFRSLSLQADAAGFKMGSPERQRFMKFGGSDSELGAAKTVTYRDGTAVVYPRVGPPTVYAQGVEVTDPSLVTAAINAGVQSGVDEAGAMAGARAQGTGTEARAQDLITRGQAAADSSAVIRRSLELLDSVETGGFEPAKLAIARAFKVEGANEGELSANLGRNVLGQLRETFGAAFTENEGRRLESMSAGFGSSVGVNKRLLNQALAIATRSADRAIERAKARGDFETAYEIEDALEFQVGIEAPVSEELPPIPTVFIDSITPAEWASMSPEERADFTN